MKAPAILDLCQRKTRAGKSHPYYDIIVFEKLVFKMLSLFKGHLKLDGGAVG